MYTYIMYHICKSTYVCSIQGHSTPSCSLSATVMTASKVVNPRLRIQGYLQCKKFMKFGFILSITVLSTKSSPRDEFPMVKGN